MNVQVNPHFYNFLAEGNIISGTKAETAQEAISELARLLARNTAGLNAQEIIEEVMLREKRMPTVIGSGLAVPACTFRTCRPPPCRNGDVRQRN